MRPGPIKCLSRGAGLIVGLLAAVLTPAAMYSRPDDREELWGVYEFCVQVGGLYPLALLLLTAPSLRDKSRRWYVAVIVVSALLWSGISGLLILHHRHGASMRGTDRILSEREIG